MLSIERYSELLELLYAAPFHQEKWVQFLDTLCDCTHSKSAYLMCADSRLSLSVRAQGGGGVLQPVAVEAYRENYAPNDPYRLALIRSGKTGVLDCEELVPRQSMLQSEFYRDIIAPAGLSYPALIVLDCSVRRLEAISFWRTLDEGPMNDDDLRLLNLLVPHIRSALEIRQVLGVMMERLEGAEAMADATDAAAFVLNRRGEILHRNKASEAIVRSSGPLREQSGRLVAADSAGQQKLIDLLRIVSSCPQSSDARGTQSINGNHSMSGNHSTSGNHSMSLDRGPGRQPLALLATPIVRAKRWPAHSVLLVVHDPEQPIETPDQLLRQMYSLTTAEIELASGLMTGYSLEEISILRKVSLGTTRIQLKSVFGKTQTHSQTELIRLLSRLPRASRKN